LNYIKQLAGQTAIYGMGIVLPRVLNYLLLTPFYTRIFSPEQYGVITELYAYIVFLMVILTYGLETGFFRFADKENNKDDVYKTSLITIFVSSSLFILLIFVFARHIAIGLDYEANSNFIIWLGIIVGLDAFTSIPFAKIRLDNRPVKYAIVRVAEVGVNIASNWFFLIYCPNHVNETNFLNFIYHPEIGVGYVLISNLVATGVKTILLAKEIFDVSGKFVFDLLRKILPYSLPLLVAGLAGTVNEAIDRVLLKHLVPVEQGPLHQLGIYGANYKLAVLMTLFIQMFRYAAEPFFFSKKNDKNAKQIYADVMKYFVFFCVMIFLLVTLFMDYFKFFIGPEFREGIRIVPIVLLANLFMGIFYNLSVWYKLTNLTKFGAYIVLTGAFLTFIINFLFIPKYGFYASAWGHFISYSVMMIISYVFGRKYYKIPYDIKSILFYIVTGVIFYFLYSLIHFNSLKIEIILKALTIIFLFLGFYLSERKKLKLMIS
jgi:O-antigen/teichoic acid export membrane protein